MFSSEASCSGAVSPWAVAAALGPWALARLKWDPAEALGDASPSLWAVTLCVPGKSSLISPWDSTGTGVRQGGG